MANAGVAPRPQVARRPDPVATRPTASRVPTSTPTTAPPTPAVPPPAATAFNPPPNAAVNNALSGQGNVTDVVRSYQPQPYSPTTMGGAQAGYGDVSNVIQGALAGQADVNSALNGQMDVSTILRNQQQRGMPIPLAQPSGFNQAGYRGNMSIEQLLQALGSY